MPIREKFLNTVADVLKDLRPGDDEDTVFQREAAEAHIRELLAAASPGTQGAPAAIETPLTAKTWQQQAEHFGKIASVAKKAEWLEAALHPSGQGLSVDYNYTGIECPKCGRYRVEWSGVCEKCKWNVRSGEYAPSGQGAPADPAPEVAPPLTPHGEQIKECLRLGLEWNDDYMRLNNLHGKVEWCEWARKLLTSAPTANQPDEPKAGDVERSRVVLFPELMLNDLSSAMRKKLDSLVAEFAAIRREALEEAAKAICPHCAEGILKVEFIDGMAKHRVAGGRTYEHCYAWAIRALKAQP